MKRALMVAVAAGFLGGCAHTQPQAAAPAVPPAAPAPAPVASAVAPTPASCRSDVDCASSELCVGSRCLAIHPGLAECSVAPVHFGFDEARIQDDDRPALQRAARCIEGSAGTRVVLEGNADERGTVVYNVALGSRRANAVRDYLTALGVPAARLGTVSYGKERPLCTDHDEPCWAVNRRVELNGTARP